MRPSPKLVDRPEEALLVNLTHRAVVCGPRRRGCFRRDTPCLRPRVRRQNTCDTLTFRIR